MDAEALKAEGNAALAAGNTALALEKYTAAIDAGGRNLHIYFNNRAIVKLRVGDFAGAMQDAEAALDRAPTFAKAFISKGSALSALGRAAEAVTAFEAAQALEPAHATLPNLLAQARAAAAGSSSSGSSSGRASGASSGSAGSSRSTGSAAPSAPRPAGPVSRLDAAMDLGRVACLAAGLVFMLPLGGLSVSAYRYGLLCAAALHAAALYKQYGRPRLNQEYAFSILMRGNIHLLALPLISLSLRPTFLPFFLSTVFVVLRGVDVVYDRAVAAGSGAGDKLAAALVSASLLIMPYVTGKSKSELSAMTVSARRREAGTAVTRLHSLGQVMLGILLVVSIPFAGLRDAMPTLFLWQLMSLQFTYSPAIREAFALVDAKIRSFVERPPCPAIVGRGYDRLAKWLRSMAKTEEEMQAMAQEQAANGGAGGAGGAGSRCTVM